MITVRVEYPNDGREPAFFTFYSKPPDPKHYIEAAKSFRQAMQYLGNKAEFIVPTPK